MAEDATEWYERFIKAHEELLKRYLHPYPKGRRKRSIQMTPESFRPDKKWRQHMSTLLLRKIK